MTISDNYSPDVTQGNGATTVYTGSWSPIADDYMLVYLQDAETGDLGDPLDQGVGADEYTLSFTSSGYSITLGTAPSSDYNVVRARAVTLDQTNPYSTSKGFQGPTIEDSLDKITAIAQDNRDGITRSIKFGVGSSSEATLPEPQANLLLGWNEAGDDLENKVAADIDLAAVTPFIETLLDDATAAAAASTLGVLPLAGGTLSGDVTFGAGAQILLDATISAAGANMPIGFNGDAGLGFYRRAANTISFTANSMDIFGFDGNANVMFGSTNTSPATANVAGASINQGNGGGSTGAGQFSATQAPALFLNRKGDDGTILSLRQDGTEEGTISVSGTTVSYNAFLGSHWSQFSDGGKPEVLPGTVLETIDEMCEWKQSEWTHPETREKRRSSCDAALPLGKTWDEEEVVAHASARISEEVIEVTAVDPKTKKNATVKKKVRVVIDVPERKAPVTKTVIAEKNDRLPKVVISGEAGGTAVYGVFLGWDNDCKTSNDMYVAAVGAGNVRIAKGQIIKRGDLLESNGDGCARVQADDLIRSSTIGKITAAVPVATYDDGSFLVPCVLMCG